jgi:hypothetical protein
LFETVRRSIAARNVEAFTKDVVIEANAISSPGISRKPQKNTLFLQPVYADIAILLRGCYRPLPGTVGTQFDAFPGGGSGPNQMVTLPSSFACTSPLWLLTQR